MQFTPEDFVAATGVSRETLDRLKAYDEALLDWNARMNLIGRTTVEDRWRRHFLDSAQAFTLVPEGAKTLIDLGSGAGFPGLVLAAMGAERGLSVTLVDSTQKKCAFLRAAAEAMDVKVKVLSDRIESLKALKADVVTARALASVEKLFEYSKPLVAKGGICLFLKGQNATAELTEAANAWTLDVNSHASQTTSDGVILEVKDFVRVSKA